MASQSGYLRVFQTMQALINPTQMQPASYRGEPEDMHIFILRCSRTEGLHKTYMGQMREVLLEWRESAR